MIACATLNIMLAEDKLRVLGSEVHVKGEAVTDTSSEWARRGKGRKRYFLLSSCVSGGEHASSHLASPDPAKGCGDVVPLLGAGGEFIDGQVDLHYAEWRPVASHFRTLR